ncbi:ATP-dependent helicase SGS1 [Yarrowia sp. C11]|nr:ATP-dependent helicase SGS1 [Yarrowia sp. E02]KAG5371270.1 ATP-dependent helicase SGS1 [Yarrowia sp. C11]
MVVVQGTLRFKNNLDIHKEWLLKNEGNVPKPLSDRPLKRISVNRPKSPIAKRKPPSGGVEHGSENSGSRPATAKQTTISVGLKATTEPQPPAQTHTAASNTNSMKPTIGTHQQAARSAMLTSSAGSTTSSQTHSTAQRPNVAAPVAKKGSSQTRILPDEFSELSDFDLSSDDLPTTIPRRAAHPANATTIPCTMPSVLATPKSNCPAATPTNAELMSLLELYRKLRQKPHDTLLLAQIDELEAALNPDTSITVRDTCTQVLDTPARPQSRDDSPQVVSDSEPEDELLELPGKTVGKGKEVEPPRKKSLSDFDMDDIDLDLELELDMAKKDTDDECDDSMSFSDAQEDFQIPLAPPSVTPKKKAPVQESEPIEIDSDDFESDFSVIQVQGPNGTEGDPDSSSLNPFGPARTLFPSSSPTRFNLADDDMDIEDALNNVSNRREVGASTQSILDIGIDGDDLDLSDDSGESVTAIEEDEYPWTQEVYKVLRERFNLNEFRANQLHAINATLNGDDVLVLMPTGGGKSLCYQLPALVNGGKTRGLSVVISPLISLMKDQTEALMAKNISCAMFNSSQSAQERRQSLSALSSGDIALLYVSPEMFQQSKVMQNTLHKLHEQKRLARIVIDEAHCVSSWGHDFRPDYKALVNVKSTLPGVPIMALTATANEKVRMDIQSCLRPNRRFFKQSFNRPNLYYEVRPKTKTVQQDIEALLRGRFRGQTGIIYCHSKQLCETTSETLQQAGIRANFYHAGMETEQRTVVQAAWQSGKIQVVCATIAFGMGIDKADVRYVIHCTVPRNMEGYYQETGRAGRDGRPSTCIVFFNQKDARQILFNIAKDEFLGENGKVDWQLTQRQRTHHRELMQGVINYCENRVDCRRVQVLRYFNETFDPKLCRDSCDNCRYGHEYTQETRDVTDVSKNIIKLVSAAIQESQNITVAYCCDLIRGSAIKKVKDLGHDKLAGYGTGKVYDKTTLERIVTKLILMKALRAHTERNRSGYASTYLRPDSVWKDVLMGNKEVTIITHVHDTVNKRNVPGLSRTNGQPTGEPMGFETASSYARRTNSLELLTPSGAYAQPDPKPTSRTRAALSTSTATSSIKNRVTKASSPTTAKKPVARTLNGAGLQRSTPSKTPSRAGTTATINITSDSSISSKPPVSKPAAKAATTATKATPASNTKSTSSFFDRPLSEAALAKRHQGEAYRKLEMVRSDYCNDQYMTRPSSVCSEDVLEVLSCELPTSYREFSALLPDLKHLYPSFAPHLRMLKQERESLKASKPGSKGGATLKEKFAYDS